MIVKCEELDILKPLIKRAGQAVLKYYGHAGEVQYKEQNDSPVTRADLASQEIIIGGLAQFGYPVLSEEKTDDMARLQSRRVWIIDPLDGTKDFLQNTSEFSIMIGLVEDGRPILGTVYQPASDILYYAKRGTGAYREQGDGLPMRLKVSDETKFQSVRLLVSRHHLLPAEIEVAKQLSITKISPCGSAGVKIGWIAAGQAELYINSSDKTGEWDTCAAECIIWEAGGRMTDRDGNMLQYNKEVPKNLNGFVVSNGGIHQYVIDELQSI